jgi:hypothetical protein
LDNKVFDIIDARCIREHTPILLIAVVVTYPLIRFTFASICDECVRDPVLIFRVLFGYPKKHKVTFDHVITSTNMG